MSIVARIASVISAGRIHLECVTAMIPLMTVVFIFITVFSFCCFLFCLFLRTTDSQIHFRRRSPDSCARMSPTTAARLSLGLRVVGRGEKLLPAVVAAKVERLSIAFGVESGGFVHGHSADGIFGHGFRFFHGCASFLCWSWPWGFAPLAGGAGDADAPPGGGVAPPC